MKPVLGDIYVTFNARAQCYVAFQITHVDEEGRGAVLTLDWNGQALPDEAALAAMQPAIFNFMYWQDRHQHSWVSDVVPRHWQHVGNRPPMITVDVRSYSAWPDGSLVERQRWWDALDPALVKTFKAAADGPRDTSVLIEGEGFSVPRSTSRISSLALNAAPSLALFDELPLLGTIEIEAPVPGLFAWLRTRPMINELQLRCRQDSVIDLRGSHLRRLSVDVTGVRELYLNDGLDFLSLLGRPDAGLTIHGEDGGRWLDVQTEDPELLWAGLPALDALSLRTMPVLDAGRIVDRFPGLDSLRVWGGPCVLHHLERLGELQAMRFLTLTDVFPPAGSVFPAPAQWPRLSTMWLQSIPADLAAAVKKAYKGEAAKGLDLSVRQPRKPEWLAANLDNPFRDWDGSEHITAAQAKKAATLYRKARSDALKLAVEMAGQVDDLAEALSHVGHAYAQGFNVLDRRSGFIETEEREHIYVAWVGIVDAVQAKRVDVLGEDIQAMPQAVYEAMDAVRDF